jgi:hypothetical protein
VRALEDLVVKEQEAIKWEVEGLTGLIGGRCLRVMGERDREMTTTMPGVCMLSFRMSWRVLRRRTECSGGRPAPQQQLEQQREQGMNMSRSTIAYKKTSRAMKKAIGKGI